MGIADLARQSIGELSGGQQQRVFLARALAQEPHILLMDEPFTGVDIHTQEATLDLLSRLQRTSVTIMVSTHDLNLATEHFDQVLLLNRRVVAYGPPAEVFTPQALLEAFGGRVLMLPTARWWSMTAAARTARRDTHDRLADRTRWLMPSCNAGCSPR